MPFRWENRSWKSQNICFNFPLHLLAFCFVFDGVLPPSWSSCFGPRLSPSSPHKMTNPMQLSMLYLEKSFWKPSELIEVFIKRDAVFFFFPFSFFFTLDCSLVGYGGGEDVAAKALRLLFLCRSLRYERERKRERVGVCVLTVSHQSAFIPCSLSLLWMPSSTLGQEMDCRL